MYTLEKESVKMAYVLPGGQRVPSVTTVIKVIAKDGLLRWANSIGLKGISLDNNTENSRALDIGRLFHYDVECWIREEERDIDPEFDEKYVKKAHQMFEIFLEYVNKRKAEPIESEVELMDDVECYAGTIDGLWETEDGPEFWDYKTSKEIYREHYIQVAGAYNKLLIKNGYSGYKPRIILMPKSGKLYAPDIPERVIAEAGAVWDATLKVYKHLHIMEKELAA